MYSQTLKQRALHYSTDNDSIPKLFIKYFNKQQLITNGIDIKKENYQLQKIYYQVHLKKLKLHHSIYIQNLKNSFLIQRQLILKMKKEIYRHRSRFLHNLPINLKLIPLKKFNKWKINDQLNNNKNLTKIRIQVNQEPCKQLSNKKLNFHMNRI